MTVNSGIRSALAAGWLVLGPLLAGCSSTPSRANAPGATERNVELVHEACELESSSAEKLDANADGRPDVVIVRADSRELCRALDLNFDGAIDSWIYFAADGKVRRRENDYDRDGKIDEVATFQGGVVAEKARATLLANKIDTWEFYQAGKLARTERDSNGDKLVDQWWEYPVAGCPVIHADVNNDGRPDPGASVDYCKETGYVPPERQDFRKTDSPNFQQTGSLPTELDSKKVEEGTPAPAAPAAPAEPADAKGGQK